jgi:hypothetical protein
MSEEYISSRSGVFDRLYEVLGYFIGLYCQSNEIRFESARDAVITLVIDSSLEDMPWSASLIQVLSAFAKSNPIDHDVLKRAILDEIVLLYSNQSDRTKIIDLLHEKGVLG